jgi:hypothetical protein
MQRKRRMWVFGLAVVIAIMLPEVAWVMLPEPDPVDSRFRRNSAERSLHQTDTVSKVYSWPKEASRPEARST